LKPILKKIGKTLLSLTLLAFLILLLSPMIALILKLFFGVAVKE